VVGIDYLTLGSTITARARAKYLNVREFDQQTDASEEGELTPLESKLAARVLAYTERYFENLLWRLCGAIPSPDYEA